MNIPVGQVVTELRNANIASKRVRGGEPAGASDGYEGDALGPGSYKRFVVVTQLGRIRIGQAPVQQVRLGVRCYGATPQDASSLAGEVSDALHRTGGRGTSSHWIYQSLEEEGGQPAKDPDTGQPYESGVIELIATA
jgi:hypothetical protein